MHGPGEFTLTAAVLFTLGAYGVAAGAVTRDQTVVTIGVFAFALFLIGVVWPIVTLARAGIEVVAPADATAGDEITLRVAVHGHASRLEVRALDPAGRWWRTVAPATGTLPHRVNRRGEITHVRVQLRTSAPLGVFVRVRQARVRLPVPLLVAPAPRPAGAAVGPVREDALVADTRPTTGVGSDAVRTVRPYVAGDAARLVHWPTSARRGALVVREHDPPAAHGLAIVVDLSGPEEWADEAAAVAAGVGRAALAAGATVLVCTFDRHDGPVCAPVGDTRMLGRRLARAGAGRPAEAPAGWPVQHVRAVDAGDWRSREW